MRGPDSFKTEPRLVEAEIDTIEHAVAIPILAAATTAACVGQWTAAVLARTRLIRTVIRHIGDAVAVGVFARLSAHDRRSHAENHHEGEPEEQHPVGHVQF